MDKQTVRLAARLAESQAQARRRRERAERDRGWKACTAPVSWLARGLRSRPTRRVSAPGRVLSGRRRMFAGTWVAALVYLWVVDEPCDQDVPGLGEHDGVLEVLIGCPGMTGEDLD